MRDIDYINQRTEKRCKNVDNRLNNTQLTILNMVWNGKNKANPPKIRDLMRATGVTSPNAICCHLKKLRDMGLVTWETGKETGERNKAKTLMPLCRLVLPDQLGKETP